MRKMMFLTAFALSLIVFSVSVFACPLHDEKLAAEKTVEKI